MTTMGFAQSDLDAKRYLGRSEIWCLMIHSSSMLSKQPIASMKNVLGSCASLLLQGGGLNEVTNSEHTDGAR